MDLVTWIYAGGGAAAAAEVYGKFGMNYLFTSVISAESGLRGSKAYLEKDDFKGSKIRMSGMFQGKILQDLGAAQVMLAGQETYQALEKGVIDAAEFSTPDNDWTLGFHEVTSVWNTPGWHQPASCAGIMINQKAWDALTPELQQKIKIAAQANVVWSIAHYNYNSGVYAKKWLDKGVKVETLKDKAIADIQKTAYGHFVEEAEKNPTFAKVVYSLYDTMEVISYWRDKELPLLRRDVTLPDMDRLKKAAEQ
jgi:TRAP-type mannitol/chloroaromatic compound transport system substrate-binding protein